MMLERLDQQHTSTDAPSNGAVSRKADTGADVSPAKDTLWYHALDRLPMGVAILDATGAKTCWVNAALKVLLREGTGATEVTGRAPIEYMPGLQPDDWEDVLASLPETDGSL